MKLKVKELELALEFSNEKKSIVKGELICAYSEDNQRTIEDAYSSSTRFPKVSLKLNNQIIQVFNLIFTGCGIGLEIIKARFAATKVEIKPLITLADLAQQPTLSMTAALTPEGGRRL